MALVQLLYTKPKINRKTLYAVFVCFVFLVLSKAFDRVNHRMLLDNLKLLGIKHKSLLWFTSYLTDRYQSVNYNGIEPPLIPLQCGLPQGSVLGPLLFCCILMIFPMFLLNSLKFYLQMI